MVQPEDFATHVGQEIIIEGIAQRSKAGAFLVAGDQEIWLKNYDWKDSEMGVAVQVKGILSRGVDPLSSFPVATQDENGAWSQGVGGFSSDLKPNDMVSLKESWLLEVKSVSVVSN